MTKKSQNESGPIETLEQLLGKAKKIANTTEHEHTAAYTNAAEALLKDAEGNIDYELLEEPDIQDKFVDKMTDHYLKKAKDYFKSNVSKGDKFQTDLLLEAYAGITGSQLRSMIKTHGKDYTHQQHEHARGELVKRIRQKLNQTAASHLKDEHVPDLVKKMGIEDIVDASKMKAEDAAELYGVWKEKGALSHEMIGDVYRAQGASPIFLKPKKKQNEEYKKAA